MMRGMSYLSSLGLGRCQQGPHEFAFTISHDAPYGLGYNPTEEDARHMAQLCMDRVRARLFGIPFDYPFHPYTFCLADYFIKGLEHVPPIEGIDHISEIVDIQDIQQALSQVHLSSGITEASDVVIVAPSSPSRANMFSMCFPDEDFDYGLLVDSRGGPDGVTLDDAYTDEMDMIGIGRILDAIPHRPHSVFDLFSVSMLEMDGDDFIANVATLSFISVEGASNPVDPPLSFDFMSGFVTYYDVMSDGNNNDMSLFEYLPVSQHFLLIAPQAPTTPIHDIDDVGDPNEPLSGKSDCDSDSEERKVTPVSGSVESVDFGTSDQPKELKIGSSPSLDERSRLIDLLRSYLDVFAWSYENMPGLDPSIVQHHLPILPYARLVKQKLRRLQP